MLKRKISAWNYIILVLSYLMGWKFMSSQSECSKPVLVNFIIIFFFIGTPLICSSITCLHVEQSQLSSTGPKSVRNLVDFSEIEPGCFMRRALPNLAVLKVDRIQNWMHGREHWSPCYYGGETDIQEVASLNPSTTYKTDLFLHLFVAKLYWCLKKTKK